MDRLTSMEAFAKAVEFGSFSAAGEALHMSSQLVGKHVQMLEQHLGVKLIQRTTRRHHLTEAGLSFYERVKVILAEVADAESVAAISAGIPRGRLRINAPVSFGIHALSRLLPTYLSKYPEVTIDLSLSNRYADIHDEGFDIIFRVGKLSDSSLMVRTLKPYRLRLCAAPSYLAKNHAIEHPTDLERHECLGFSHTELRTHWTFETPEEQQITVCVTSQLMIDSGEALLVAACSGMGLILQPSELVDPALQTGQLIEVLPDYPAPVRPFHLLYAPDRRMTPKLRSFIDFAIDAFGP